MTVNFASFCTEMVSFVEKLIYEARERGTCAICVVVSSGFLMDEFIGTTSLGKASALLSSIPRLYNSPTGERKKPKYMSLFFL